MARRVTPEFRTEQFKFMVRAAREGISANRALQALRTLGMGLGRTLGLRMFKQARAANEQHATAAALDWNNPIPAGFGVPWPSGVRTDQTVTVKLVIRNHVTGEYDELYHRTYNAEGITPGEAIQNAYDAYSEPKYSDAFSIEAAVVWNVMQHIPAVV